MTLTVGIILLVLLGLTAFAGRWLDMANMMNRAAVWAAGLGVLLGAVSPNPYLGVLFAVSGIAIMLRPNPSQILFEDVYWSLALAASFIAVVPYMTRAMVPWLLFGIVGVGLVTTFYWDRTDITAGQGNVMHTQSLSALAAAAACGLALMGWWIGSLLFLATIVPILKVQRTDNRLTLGTLYLFVLAFAVVDVLYSGWIAFLEGGVAFLGAFWYAWPKTLMWSGRKEWWTAGFAFWWQKLAWWQQLVGLGPHAWVLFSQQYRGQFNRVGGENSKWGYDYVCMPHAHNDYLQVLFERGAIGLLALLAYLINALWITFHAGPDGQAVFLVGLTLCAVAFANFPWTGLVVGYLPEHRKVCGYGCPALNYLSWLLIVMVEVFR